MAFGQFYYHIDRKLNYNRRGLIKLFQSVGSDQLMLGQEGKNLELTIGFPTMIGICDLGQGASNGSCKDRCGH